VFELTSKQQLTHRQISKLGINNETQKLKSTTQSQQQAAELNGLFHQRTSYFLAHTFLMTLI